MTISLEFESEADRHQIAQEVSDAVDELNETARVVVDIWEFDALTTQLLDALDPDEEERIGTQEMYRRQEGRGE